jgi:hypothetical protein
VKPRDLLATARRLTRASGAARPRQSDLKRGLSTVYYAVFHAIRRNCADCLIGGSSADRSLPAWRQTYRAVEHARAKDQCRNRAMLAKFPKEVEDFAAFFVAIQERRHRADYDPAYRVTRTMVEQDIALAERAIQRLTAAPIKDRRAFAAWVLFRARAD